MRNIKIWNAIFFVLVLAYIGLVITNVELLHKNQKLQSDIALARVSLDKEISEFTEKSYKAGNLIFIPTGVGEKREVKNYQPVEDNLKIVSESGPVTQSNKIGNSTIITAGKPNDVLFLSDDFQNDLPNDSYIAESNGPKWESDLSPDKLQINFPSPISFSFYNQDSKMIFSIGKDGKITFGPGFTTKDKASHEFWDILKRSFDLKELCQ
jgi:hypothetical protein